jgi:hypothetical protein
LANGGDGPTGTAGGGPGWWGRGWWGAPRRCCG